MGEDGVCGVGDMHTRMNATISSFSATPLGEWIRCSQARARKDTYLLELAVENFEARAVVLRPERVGEHQGEREDRHGRWSACSSCAAPGSDIADLVLDRPFFLGLVCTMGHVANRLYSRVAVSAAHLNQFPPREAIVRQAGKVTFDPQSWAALQPPPPSALAAFAHRIGLGSVAASPDAVRRACTHKSFVNLHAKYYPSSPAPPTNADLATLGNSLMGLFASEYLHASYPHLPTRVLKAAVSAHVGPLTCASVAQEMGATPLLRWHRQVRSSTVSGLVTLTSLYLAIHAYVASTSALRRARVNTACADRISLPREVALDSSQIRPFSFPKSPCRLADHVKIPRSKTRSHGNSRKIW